MIPRWPTPIRGLPAPISHLPSPIRSSPPHPRFPGKSRRRRYLLGKRVFLLRAWSAPIFCGVQRIRVQVWLLGTYGIEKEYLSLSFTHSLSLSRLSLSTLAAHMPCPSSFSSSSSSPSSSPPAWDKRYGDYQAKSVGRPNFPCGMSTLV